MNKASLALLERAYSAEMASKAAPDRLHSHVDYALTKQGSGLLHTKAKLAQKLVEGGMLQLVELDAGRDCIFGYMLTHLGRMTYCMEVAQDKSD